MSYFYFLFIVLTQVFVTLAHASCPAHMSCSVRSDSTHKLPLEQFLVVMPSWKSSFLLFPPIQLCWGFFYSFICCKMFFLLRSTLSLYKGRALLFRASWRDKNLIPTSSFVPTLLGSSACMTEYPFPSCVEFHRVLSPHLIFTV